MKKDGTGALVKEKLDAALAQTKANGSLSQLSLDWFGVDYSQ
jgi:ABC-type amino acid transport substrate-binding protein